jgi:hypothetical protein
MPRLEEYDSDDDTEQNERLAENDQFENEPDSTRQYDERPVDYGNDEEDGAVPQEEQAPAGNYDPNRRQFKYSTADMHESGRCRKYCMIFLLFMLFFLVMIGLSMLFQWLFFSKGATDNAAQFPERDANSTFPSNKGFIDQVCSTGTFDADEGARCREACEPQFFACCDPFAEFKNVVLVRDNSTNMPSMAPSAGPTSGPTRGPTSGPTRGPTSGPTQGPSRAPTDTIRPTSSTGAPTRAPAVTLDPTGAPSTSAPTTTTFGPTTMTFSPTIMNSTDLDFNNTNSTEDFFDDDDNPSTDLSRGEEIGVDDVNNDGGVYPLAGDDPLLQCSFDQETRGCMSYSKCQAIGGLIDPAPSTLPILCAAEGLERDRTSCEEACRRARCCWAEEGKNCLGRNFDICIDYAPCQNLRVSDVFIVETAPDDLDQACLWELPECFETCAEAECCGNPDSSCFRDNFIACLTFTPCTNVTITNINIPPMYSVVSAPPIEIKYACNADNEGVLEPTTKTCAEYCQESACCREDDQQANCFNFDPLGCVQWQHQCQMLNEVSGE